MNNIEDDIKSIKMDCRIIRWLLCIIVGGTIGYIWGGHSAKPKADNARQDGNNYAFYNPAERGADKSPATTDSITAFLQDGAVLQPD